MTKDERPLRVTMLDETTLLILCAAGAVASLAFFVMKLTVGQDRDARLRGRLSKAAVDPLAAPAAPKPNLRAGLAGGVHPARAGRRQPVHADQHREGVRAPPVPSPGPASTPRPPCGC
jgi:hypothetical protein